VKPIIFSCLFCLCLPLVAQVNLVPNPSFEEYNNCPNIESAYLDSSNTTFKGVKYWFKASEDFQSEYHHTCAPHPFFSVPYGSAGFQNTHSGSAYLLFLSVAKNNSLEGRRGYSSTLLLNPLYKDSLYKISYWVSLAEMESGNLSNRNLLATSSIGVYFSCEKLFSPSSSYISVNPQVQNNPTRFLDDTLGWMEITGLYRATGGEQYITIGNFNSNENTPIKIVRYGNTETTQGVGSYYLDDVSLISYGYLQDTYLDTTLCEGITLTKGIRPGFDSCVWNDGGTSQSRIIEESGLYWVTSYSGNVSVTDTFNITYKPYPIITSLKDTTVCFEQVAQILLDAGQFKSYLWKPTGETTRTIYSNTAQVYLLSVTDTNNCSTSKQVAVMETCPDFVFIPNAFTPNGDGLNDVFLPKTRNLSSYNMSIVNRWGEIIFTTTNPQQGWDGKGAPSDVYVVLINYQVDGKELQSVKQNVSLLR
jgi:gliding motility-associated-like protein